MNLTYFNLITFDLTKFDLIKFNLIKFDLIKFNLIKFNLIKLDLTKFNPLKLNVYIALFEMLPFVQVFQSMEDSNKTIGIEMYTSVFGK